MTDDASTRLLVIDVEGLPARVTLPTTPWQRRTPLVQIGFGGAYLCLLLLWGPQPVLVVVAVSWVVLGLLGVLSMRRVHLRLEPEGVRRVGVVGRGRLTPWADAAEVRPPDAWHEVSHLRGHGRFPETTDLPGLSGEDARELQRRLVGAREKAGLPEVDGRGA